MCRSEKFEDTTDTPPEKIPEEAKEAVLEELTEHPPKLHHVETVDTTDPSSEPTSEGGVVKAEVPEAFQEELKKDHDIVPSSDEKPASAVETVASETGAEDGATAPATRDVPVEVTHQDVDTKTPSKISSFGDKISSTLHKIVGKD